ncbi:MAG: universal stress protein [Flammeovirgaceae bacterium]|nr:universal stress protein [Flammeovirgaceae bacterium]MDW8286972.1 universal stress protein [Flammeovirgaceae bacterium]
MEVQKILVPTDFSSESLYALELAVYLTQDTDIEILLYHVITEKVGERDRDKMKAILADVQKNLKILKSKFPESKIVEEIHVDINDEGVAKVLSKISTDLIIMGSKGAGNLKNIVLGSNAEKVIRTAKAPVITVKEPFKKGKIEYIILASDFVNVPIRLVQIVDWLQGMTKARLSLLSIYLTQKLPQEIEHAQERMKEFIKQHKLNNTDFQTYQHISIDEGIMEYAVKHNADLVAMSTQGRKGLVALVLGSIASGVANHSPIPVLTVNEQG